MSAMFQGLQCMKINTIITVSRWTPKVNVDGSVSDPLWPQSPLSVPVMALSNGQGEESRYALDVFPAETRYGVERGPIGGQPVYNCRGAHEAQNI